MSDPDPPSATRDACMISFHKSDKKIQRWWPAGISANAVVSCFSRGEIVSWGLVSYA